MCYFSESRTATEQYEGTGPSKATEKECQEVRQRETQKVQGRVLEPSRGEKVRPRHSCNSKTRKMKPKRGRHKTKTGAPTQQK